MVNEPVNDSPAGGITARRASFVRVLQILAMVVVLLGGPGAFLALPMTLFVAVMLDTFPETRWLANVVGVSAPAKSESPT
jgi:predicted PurR-regulated permease PerM